MNLRSTFLCLRPFVIKVCAILCAHDYYYSHWLINFNKGMKDRHWKEIKDTLGITIVPDEVTSLSKLIGPDYKLDTHLEALENISDGATKEFAIETSLVKMQSEWQPLLLETKSWKTTGTYILNGASVEAIQTILDDHIVKSQTMNTSPYAKCFGTRISDWNSFLVNAQDILTGISPFMMLLLYRIYFQFFILAY
jgi:dynein heavy chain